MKQAYPIILTPDNGEYVVTVPGFDINTSGKDIADAIFMAEDAIRLCGITLQDMGKEVPTPGLVQVEYKAGDIPAFAVVDFDAYRRANETRTVRKNVSLPSYLNELAERAGTNFSQVLQDGLKAKLGVQWRTQPPLRGRLFTSTGPPGPRPLRCTSASSLWPCGCAGKTPVRFCPGVSPLPFYCGC